MFSSTASASSLHSPASTDPPARITEPTALLLDRLLDAAAQLRDLDPDTYAAMASVIEQTCVRIRIARAPAISIPRGMRQIQYQFFHLRVPSEPRWQEVARANGLTWCPEREVWQFPEDWIDLVLNLLSATFYDSDNYVLLPDHQLVCIPEWRWGPRS